MNTILACILVLLVASCMSSYIVFVLSTRDDEEKRRPGGWRRRGQGQGRARLPPGSMGWPYIGETLQLYSRDPNIFFANKQKSAARLSKINAMTLDQSNYDAMRCDAVRACRYGEIFKSHILGCPCVMLSSPEAARFVLATHAHLFKPTYPKSKETFIGPSALFFHQGEYHTSIRKLVQASLSPDAIRPLIPDIEVITSSAIDSWAAAATSTSAPLVVNTFQEMKKISFEVGILAIFGHQLEERYKEELKRNYAILDKGYNSFPTIIPGTPYKKALTARKRLRMILSDIVRARKERRLEEKDLVGCFLGSSHDLSDDQITDNVIGVLFAAQDTTASVMTWILKYLHDNPKLLEAVRGEQRAIYEANDGGKKPLTWAQTRNMPLSHKFVLESLRMASILSFTFREAVADVEYKGYLIPKGWKVLPLFRNIHHSPEFFPDPHRFDSSRFEVAPKPNTFMPFGTGEHACPGNELAKLEMLIMIHHLVTKFRWELVGPEKGGIQHSPFPVPSRGLPARFWKL